MMTNRWILAIFCTWLLCSTAAGQQPTTPIFPPPPPIPGNGDTGAAPAPPPQAVGGLSDWIVYNNDAAAARRDCCEGSLHRLTPLYTELYLRVGPSVPIGGKTLSHELETGWSIVAGGRALFFDTPTTAWTVDPHFINTNESGGRENTKFPISITVAGAKKVFGVGGVPGVTIRASNRSMVGLGLGREWYLWGSADSHDCNWRVGFDFGGRYGSHRLDLNETRHLTDVIYGYYFAVHTDLEIPIHHCIFFTGLRLEYAATNGDVISQNGNLFPQNSNVADLNFLATFGWRF
jgi:hypothetical protein